MAGQRSVGRLLPRVGMGAYQALSLLHPEANVAPDLAWGCYWALAGRLGCTVGEAAEIYACQGDQGPALHGNTWYCCEIFIF